MEENKLVRRTPKVPAYIEQSMQSIEGMMKYADVLLKSKLCPSHMYEKGPDNKPDYTKGKPEAVLIVLQHGMEIGLSVSQSLQQIVPVNNLISIKGSGAKSLVFNSGVLKHGTWKEEVTGSIENEDYEVRITSTRLDNGATREDSFSVNDSKKAGLWITKQMVEGKDGWKFKHSPWWKYQKLMIFWRCLGIHTRLHYPDVLAGLYTTEEAQDMPQDPTEVIETASGATVTIPDKEHVAERSESLTSKVADKIAKNNVTIPEAEVVPEQEQEAHVYTEFELSELGPKICDEVEKYFPDLVDKLNAMPGKNTNKKWRLGVLALQAGRFDEYSKQTTDIEGKKEPESNVSPEEKTPEDKEFEANMGSGPEEEPKQVTESEGVTGEKDGIIHHKIIISVLPESGARAFQDIRQIFQGLQANGMDEDTYKKIATELVVEATGETFISAYMSMQLFSKHATAEQVVELIDVFLPINQ